MESLQHVWNDLAGRMRKLPRRTQVLIATGAILCLSAFALVNRAGGKHAEIALLPDMLSPRQISAYQIAFADAGLTDFRIEKQKIFVPKIKKLNFMSALAKANLLKASSGKYLEKALDSSSPFENQEQRKQRIKIAQEREFAQTISQFDGIEEATVQYDAKEKKGLAHETIFTASVTVRAKNDKPLTTQQGQIIKNYLAGCIAGLEPDAIYIVDLNPSPDPVIPLTRTEHFSPAHSEIQSNVFRQDSMKPIQSPESFPAGTLAIVGTALVAGCVALLRRKNGLEINDRCPVSDPVMLDVEFPDQPQDKKQISFPDLSVENATISKPFSRVGDHAAKARLLLAGQSDYSHLIPNQQTDGIELTTMEAPSNSEAGQTPKSSAESEVQPPFAFVHHANSEDLFEILITEDARVIATVFSHLPPEQSADLLSRLPDATQVKVLQHLGDLSLASNESTKKISKNIAKRLSVIIKRNEKRKAGMQAVGDLLDFIDAKHRSKLLEQLQLPNADLTHLSKFRVEPNSQPKLEVSDSSGSDIPKITNHLAETETPEVILKLTGDQLCELFAAMDPRDAVLALAQWDSKVTQKLTASMQSQDVLRLEKSLRNIRGQKVDKSDSCLKVLETAERLIASGKFFPP